MQFSIIIPIFNSKAFLPDIINSLINQTYKNFEVILIDDNSTDGSFELAKKLCDESTLIATVLRKPIGSSRGVSSSRNWGVANCNYSWICFLDSDDFFHFRKLEILVQHIREGINVDLWYHPLCDFSNEREIPKSNELPIELNGQFSSIYDENIVATSSVTISKSVFQEFGGFNEELNGVEDYHLWLKVFSTKKTYCINKVMGYYRVLDISLMRGRPLIHYVRQNTTFVKQISFLDQERFLRVRNYMIYKLINYYTNESIRCHGYISIYSGLIKLFFRGYPLFAISLFFNKSKNVLKYFFKKKLSAI